MQEPIIGKIEMTRELTAPGVEELQRQLDAHTKLHEIADKNADKHTETFDDVMTAMINEKAAERQKQAALAQLLEIAEKLDAVSPAERAMDGTRIMGNDTRGCVIKAQRAAWEAYYGLLSEGVFARLEAELEEYSRETGHRP